MTTFLIHRGDEPVEIVFKGFQGKVNISYEVIPVVEVKVSDQAHTEKFRMMKQADDGQMKLEG